MLKELEDYDWEQAFGEGENYAGITPTAVLTAKGAVGLDGINREAVEEVLAMEAGEHDGADWVGVFRLKDGRWISVASGCDYTGWDCQSSGSVEVARSKDEILRFGVTEEMRRRLKLPEPSAT